MRSSLRSCANPNSRSFSLIFGFARFILRPVKIKSTGSVGDIVSIFIASSGSCTARTIGRLRGRIAREGRSRRLSEILKGFKVKSIRAYEGDTDGLYFTSAKYIYKSIGRCSLRTYNLTSRKITRRFTYKRDSDIKRKLVLGRFVTEQI